MYGAWKRKQEEQNQSGSHGMSADKKSWLPPPPGFAANGPPPPGFRQSGYPANHGLLSTHGQPLGAWLPGPIHLGTHYQQPQQQYSPVQHTLQQPPQVSFHSVRQLPALPPQHLPAVRAPLLAQPTAARQDQHGFLRPVPPPAAHDGKHVYYHAQPSLVTKPISRVSPPRLPGGPSLSIWAPAPASQSSSLSLQTPPAQPQQVTPPATQQNQDEQQQQAQCGWPPQFSPLSATCAESWLNDLCNALEDPKQIYLAKQDKGGLQVRCFELKEGQPAPDSHQDADFARVPVLDAKGAVVSDLDREYKVVNTANRPRQVRVVPLNFPAGDPFRLSAQSHPTELALPWLTARIAHQNGLGSSEVAPNKPWYKPASGFSLEPMHEPWSSTSYSSLNNSPAPSSFELSKAALRGPALVLQPGECLRLRVSCVRQRSTGRTLQWLAFVAEAPCQGSLFSPTSELHVVCRRNLAIHCHPAQVSSTLSAESQPFFPERVRKVFNETPTAKLFGTPHPIPDQSEALLSSLEAFSREDETSLDLPPALVQANKERALIGPGQAVAKEAFNKLLREHFVRAEQVRGIEPGGHDHFYDGFDKTLRLHALLRAALDVEELQMAADVVGFDLFFIKLLPPPSYYAEWRAKTDHKYVCPVQYGGCGHAFKTWGQCSQHLSLTRHLVGDSLEVTRSKCNAQLSLPSQFASVDVPGVGERRPAVNLGDPVTLRPVQAPEFEITAYIYAVRETFVVLCLPLNKMQEMLLKADPSKRAIIPDISRFAFDVWQFHVRFSPERLAFQLIRRALSELRGVRGAKLQHLIFPENANLSQVDTAGSLLDVLTQDASAYDDMQPVPTQASQNSAPTKMLELFDSNCNAEQRQAVSRILRLPLRSPPYVIFGPPGTGKTLTLVEAILQVDRALQWQAQRSRDPTHRPQSILAVAPSNYAADVLLARLAESKNSDLGSAPGALLRINAWQRHTSIAPHLLRYCSKDQATDLYDVPSYGRLLQARVIVSTAVGAGLLVSNDRQNELNFAYLFVDEACQALEAELYVPLQLAGEETRVVLAGDPCQLGPTIHTTFPKALRLLQRSWLQRLLSLPPYLEASEEAENNAAKAVSASSAVHQPQDTDTVAVGNPATMRRQRQFRLCLDETGFVSFLSRNYRCHPMLLRLTSSLFYDQTLVPCASPRITSSLIGWRRLPNQRGFPFLFCGIRSQDQLERHSRSFFNTKEANKLVELIQDLLAAPEVSVTRNDIGVIAPFRKQVLLIRRLLRARGLGAIRVGSVDDYQGQEEKVIFLSTVLSRVRPQWKQAHQLLANARRFNVATSRAQALLVVTGNPSFLQTEPCWRALLRYAVVHGAYTGIKLHSSIAQLGAPAPSTDSAEASQVSEEEQKASDDANGQEEWVDGGGTDAWKAGLGSVLNDESDEDVGDQNQEVSATVEEQWRIML
eukprot:g32429.t1